MRSVAAAAAIVVLAGCASTQNPPVPPIPPTYAAHHLADRQVPGVSRSHERKPAPKPKPKPVVKAAPKPPAPKPVFVPASAAVTMACIRKHESGGSYTARNGIYRGAYQLSMTYSDDWARRYGQSAWASRPADQWPKAVQDAVALGLGKDSHWRAWSDWTSYSCPGFRS